jgi:hypothetical protein
VRGRGPPLHERVQWHVERPPIVAGAAILVESMLREQGRAPLGPRAVRDLLRETGSPQTGDTREQIGPRPDLERAMTVLVPYDREY